MDRFERIVLEGHKTLIKDQNALKLDMAAALNQELKAQGLLKIRERGARARVLENGLSFLVAMATGMALMGTIFGLWVGISWGIEQALPFPSIAAYVELYTDMGGELKYLPGGLSGLFLLIPLGWWLVATNRSRKGEKRG